MGQSVESFAGAYFAKLDGLIGGLTKKTYWPLWVGTIAVVLSLATHTPHRVLLNLAASGRLRSSECRLLTHSPQSISNHSSQSCTDWTEWDVSCTSTRSPFDFPFL